MSTDARLRFPRFAHERLVLLLVAVAALSFSHPANTQDKTRLALTQALSEHGETAIERYGVPTDRARYGGHYYTDKAPGLSLLAVPVVAPIRLGERVTGSRTRLIWESGPKLWIVRAAVVGPFLLLLTWMVGRVAEGLIGGTGAATAVALALGTLVGPLSSILFAHVPAAALCFAAFVLVARSTGRWATLLAGGLAGAAVLIEYQAALAVLGVAAYLVVRGGGWSLLRFASGAALPIAVLALYNAAAFDSPLHLSYSYIDGAFASEQAGGFFGIGSPDGDSLVSTLFGARGLLVVSPYVAAASLGLVFLWSRGLHAETVLACFVAVAYLALEAGYFLPYGGYSPGPRFLTPAIPFLLLGLPFALAARPRLVGALIALSVALSTANALTWPAFAPGEPFDPVLPETVWSPGAAPRAFGVIVVCVAAAAALILSLRSLSRGREDRPAARAGIG